MNGKYPDLLSVECTPAEITTDVPEGSFDFKEHDWDNVPVPDDTYKYIPKSEDCYEDDIPF
jgi:hypothetical protein